MYFTFSLFCSTLTFSPCPFYLFFFSAPLHLFSPFPFHSFSLSVLHLHYLFRSLSSHLVLFLHPFNFVLFITPFLTCLPLSSAPFSSTLFFNRIPILTTTFLIYFILSFFLLPSPYVPFPLFSSHLFSPLQPLSFPLLTLAAHCLPFLSLSPAAYLNVLSLASALASSTLHLNHFPFLFSLAVICLFLFLSHFSSAFTSSTLLFNHFPLFTAPVLCLPLLFVSHSSSPLISYTVLFNHLPLLT